MKNSTVMKAITGISFVLLSSNLYAQDYSALNNEQLDQRIAYLDNSFNQIQQPYNYWQYGWTSVYAVTGAAQLYGAIDADDSDDSTKNWVGTVKSVGGLALMLIKPVPLVAGYSDYQSMPYNSREEKIARLTKAEKMLEQTAWRSDDRYTLKPHAMTIGINLLGAAAISAWGDSSDAFASAALGIAIGEAAIWTQPTAADQQWNSYKNHFNGEESSISWHLVPKINGLELVAKF